METDSKTILRRERAKLRLKMLAGFKDVPILSVPEIPTHREPFPGTNNGYWTAVNKDDESRTTCIYELDPKGIFPTHLHNHTELCTLLTKNANVEYITEDGIFNYKYPSTFLAAAGCKHALVNNCDFVIKIKVEWFPKIEGEWQATFPKKD